MISRVILAIVAVFTAFGLATGGLLPRPVGAAPAESGYKAQSPEYGMSVFVYGNARTTDRDLAKLTTLGFGWQKSLFRWRDIEGDCKNCFTWDESDRIVKASTDAGLKIIARLDFQPTWARADGAWNGAPDNYQDFADFVGAFMERYKAGSRHGTVNGIEIWNEVNLQREWGAPISAQSAADYVQLLGLAYRAAKKADPNVTVITAGLSPTGWNDDTARPDDDYLQWMFAAGLKGGVNYDVLAAHGNTQCPSVEANFGACPVLADRMTHPSFYFRRIEQLRDIQVANGDKDSQIWLLEFGWTTDTVNEAYSWYATDESTKAELIVKAFNYAAKNWTPWIGVMVVWTLSDPAWTLGAEQVYWAVTNPDGSTRPAYDRLLTAKASGELPKLGASGTTTPAPRSTGGGSGGSGSSGGSTAGSGGGSGSGSSGSGASSGSGSSGTGASSGSGSSGGSSSGSGSTGTGTSSPRSGSTGQPAPVSGNIAPPAMAPLGGGSGGGGGLQVVGTDGEGVNLRATPSTSGLVIKRIAEGTTVQSLGAPRQAEGRSWRNVRDPDGSEGWVAAEYLSP